MFGYELVIGSIRAQGDHIKRVLEELESDVQWRGNKSYYSKELQDIEKRLRRIRKNDFEAIDVYETHRI